MLYVRSALRGCLLTRLGDKELCGIHEPSQRGQVTRCIRYFRDFSLGLALMIKRQVARPRA